MTIVPSRPLASPRRRFTSNVLDTQSPEGFSLKLKSPPKHATKPRVIARWLPPMIAFRYVRKIHGLGLLE